MFSHVTIGTNDSRQAVRFYDALMSVLGFERFYGDEESGYCGYGDVKGAQLWVLPPFDGKRATVGNGTHIALFATTRQQVRDAYAAALANGGSDEGAPGLRAHYHPNYYGAYFRDPDGNKLQVVCHFSGAKAGD